jgi:hypothetical protein
MRFEIPQFINIQDKIFGRFTFREALYLVGGGGIIYVFLQLLPTFLAIFFGVPVGIFSLALVFYRPNGRPFIDMVEAYVLFSFTQKFYLWRQKEGDKKLSSIERVSGDMNEDERNKEKPKEKISDLAWSLDILDFEDK